MLGTTLDTMWFRVIGKMMGALMVPLIIVQSCAFLGDETLNPDVLTIVIVNSDNSQIFNVAARQFVNRIGISAQLTAKPGTSDFRPGHLKIDWMDRDGNNLYNSEMIQEDDEIESRHGSLPKSTHASFWASMPGIAMRGSELRVSHHRLQDH